MRKKTFFGAALCALLLAGGQKSFGSSSVDPKITYKLKSVHATRLNARLVQYYFSFVDNNGHNVTLSGRGTLASGRVDYFISETSSGGSVYSGTASGTFTIDNVNNTCSIDVTYTPSGHSQEYYTGQSDYDVI